jgi:Lactonase, 7-bladed beta-propeller
VTAGGASPADGKRLGEQMSKIIGGVLALAGLCALSMFLLSCGSTSSRPAGLLYVVNQGLNGSGNSISSFGINLDNGELQYLNSNASTCPTQPSSGNSSPCGLPVDILLDPTGAFPFVLNQGVPCPEVEQNGLWVCSPNSNATVPPTLYPYTLNSDGSLSGPGTPYTWACGANVSLSSCTFSDTAVNMVRDAAGQFLFVIDSGSYPSPGYPLPTAASPSCPHVPTGPTDVCPSISVFTMSSGSLTLASGSPFYLSKIPTALSVVTSPSSTNAQELLFVTNNQDICTANCVLPPPSDNTVSVYSVGSSGGLTEQPNSPYIVDATNPVAVMAVNTNQTDIPNSGGLFVYVGTNTQSGGDVYPFEICTVVNAYCTQQDVELAILTPLRVSCNTQCINVAPTAAGLNPVQMVADPTNNFLYVLSEGSSQLFAFKINTTAGTLTALAPASQPTGSQPVSMALHASVNSQGQPIYSASGQFIYVANTLSSNITAFGLSTANGTISTLGTQIAPSAPSGVAVH